MIANITKPFRAPLVGSVLSVAAMILAPGPSSAVLNPNYDQGFLVAEGTVLPANAKGIPWVGHSKFEATEDRFALWRVDGKRHEAIGLNVEVVEFPKDIRARPHYGGIVFLIVPERWVPGARYRAEELPRRMLSTRPRGPLELVPIRTVEVELSKLRFDAVEGATLEFGPADHRQMWVRTGDALEKFEVSTSEVRFQFPEAARAFRGALFYFFMVPDGKLYRRSEDFSTGSSSDSRPDEPGTDLVYDLCPGAGIVDLKMIAWLPGTKDRMESWGTLRFDCDAPVIPAP